MASDSQAPGLRERKKMKTREAIRREALRLFETKGYAGTTVEQIAQAADVSPSTFFRYFSNKAALLIPDQLMEPIIEAFLKAPPELSPVAAYRRAVEQTFNSMAGVDWAPEMARQRLLYTLPEAQGALYSEYIHTIELITQALALRLSRSPEDIELRTIAGAITGVLMTALHGTPMEPAAIYHALDFLDAGLPLTDED
jgi:AcrR family transcriptional regulator